MNAFKPSVIWWRRKYSISSPIFAMPLVNYTRIAPPGLIVILSNDAVPLASSD
jgi:hypothetical protein